MEKLHLNEEWDCVMFHVQKPFTKELGPNLEGRKDPSALSPERASLLTLLFVMTWYTVPNVLKWM